MPCSIQSQDRILDALKRNFPKADQFQIIENCEHTGNSHYTSRIVRLTVEFDEDGTRKRKSFILKQPRNNDSASYFNKFDFFAREKMMYALIIPRMNDYLDEPLTPSALRTTEPNTIILENLVASGYETGDSNRRLCDLNQCLPIFKALAYFHATSHKVGQMDPQLLRNKMLQNLTLPAELKKKACALWEPIYCEILAQNNASFLIPKLREAFDYVSQNFDEFTSSIHYSNFKFHVLSHGDFKMDNLMLKYGPNNELEGVKLIDFQTTFWSTPIYDFMRCLTLSASPEVVQNHYETLVNVYVECLNEKLEEMNCTQLYGREDFAEDNRSLRIQTILNVTYGSLLLYPSDRSELWDSILAEKNENHEKYKDVCLGDELLTEALLSNLKLFDRLGLFEL